MFFLSIVWWRHYKKNEAFKKASRREEADGNVEVPRDAFIRVLKRQPEK